MMFWTCVERKQYIPKRSNVPIEGRSSKAYNSKSYVSGFRPSMARNVFGLARKYHFVDQLSPKLETQSARPKFWCALFFNCVGRLSVSHQKKKSVSQCTTFCTVTRNLCMRGSPSGSCCRIDVEAWLRLHSRRTLIEG